MLSKSLRYLAVLALGSVTPAAAQEGGLLSPSGGLMFWTVVTFLVVLVALWKFAWPHILGAVEAREAHIRELLAAAARDREEAQRLVQEQQRQLDEVRARAQEMLAEGRAAGERAREELMSQARREQEELLQRTQREIQQQTERALEAVRLEAVDVALAAAERLLGRTLDGEDNRRLVRQFLGELDSSRVPAGV